MHTQKDVLDRDLKLEPPNEPSEKPVRDESKGYKFVILQTSCDDLSQSKIGGMSLESSDFNKQEISVNMMQQHMKNSQKLESGI